MNTEKIKTLAESIEKDRKRLDGLREARKLLDFDGHQKPLFIKMGDIPLNVSYIDSGNSYSQAVKRGYEMVRLGVVRLFNQEISKLEDEIKAAESELSSLVVGSMPF